MESKFGYNFTNVRLHNDSESNKLTRSVNAHAFTIGNNIFLSNKESVTDKKLLAHELTHTIQQNDMIYPKNNEFVIQRQTTTTQSSHQAEINELEWVGESINQVGELQGGLHHFILNH